MNIYKKFFYLRLDILNTKKKSSVQTYTDNTG